MLSHEGLPLVLAVKGPIPAAEIGLYLLPARDCEKPWLHSDIHPEGLGYLRVSSPVLLGRAGPSQTHP